MVVFTCNHCGETLHKPKVDKHYQFTCRNFKSVSCVDCFKDFLNEEYVAHIKCVTEDERYAAKGTYKNGIVKKGEVKQENWVEMIKSICETEKDLKPSVRNLLNTISEYSNVPRKKQKFMNFIKSSSGNRANMKDVEEVWDIIEKYKAKNYTNHQKTEVNNPKIENKEPGNETLESEKQPKKRSISIDNTEEGSPKKKKKKSVSDSAEKIDHNSSKSTKETNKKQKLEPFKGTKQLFAEENGNTVLEKQQKNKQKVSDILENTTKSSEIEDSTASLKFNFKEKILDILSKKQSISHNKLQKKILKAYMSATGQSECEEKVIKKFNKKLKKIPNVGIEDDKVVLQ